MSKPVNILGMGIITAGGNNVDETWESLLFGKNTRSIFPYISESKKAHMISEYKTDNKLFHMANKAINQIKLEPKPEVLCLGSSSDTFKKRETNSEIFPDPIILKLKEAYGIKEYYQFNNACSSSSYAISFGMDLIRNNEADTVLVGGVDEVTMSSIAGFDACRIYTDDKCRPFSKNRDGLLLADGAGFLLLSSKSPRQPIAFLNGSGLYSSANHMTGMEPESVSKVIEDSIEGNRQNTIDGIIVHGTGTKINDKVESEAIQNSLSNNPYITSYKRVLGHPQGASGVIGVCLSIKAICENQLFRTLPYSELDKNLESNITVNNLNSEFNNMLCLSHGTWGVYSSLMVSGVANYES